MPHAIKLAFVVILLSAAPAAAAITMCSAESGAMRVPLLELYTSEGCDSCPPTDRWVSSLPQRGYTSGRVLPLAFHVDYWNYLGWQDSYAKPAFSERQRAANQRNKSRVVYTPQLMLDGADYRRGLRGNDFSARITAINNQQPRAHINLAIISGPRLQVKMTFPDTIDRNNVRVYIAVYENGLATDVPAGENRGKRLLHDFVVRELLGPWIPDAAGNYSFDLPLQFPPHWQSSRLHIAAFAQDLTTGATLQALSLPNCVVAPRQ